MAEVVVADDRSAEGHGVHGSQTDITRRDTEVGVVDNLGYLLLLVAGPVEPDILLQAQLLGQGFKLSLLGAVAYISHVHAHASVAKQRHGLQYHVQLFDGCQSTYENEVGKVIAEMVLIERSGSECLAHLHLFVVGQRVVEDMQLLLWHTPSRQNPLGIVAIEERTGGPLHLPDGEPLLYASLVAVGTMRPQVDALAEYRGKQQNDPCREAVVCGGGEEVGVVAP